MLFAILSLLMVLAPGKEDTDSLLYQIAAGVPVEIIRVNLASPHVQIGVTVAKGMPHGAESFQRLLSRSGATAAINGAYFSKSTLEPIGDIVIGGIMVCRGWMGTALSITKDKQVSIKRVRRGFGENWAGYETVLACGPALVLNGKVDIKAEEEGFQDPHIMGSTQRMGVGVTDDNHLLLVHARTGVTFAKWAVVMLALHCRDAMNLDAGASIAMNYRGHTLHSPGRELTNILGIYVDKSPPKPEILAALDQPSNKLPPPMPIPADSSAVDAVTINLCSESLGRATEWCPVTVKRKVSRKKLPHFCTVHHAPS